MKFREFYKRKIVKIPSGGGITQEFKDFYNSHESFVVKPIRGSRGKGVILFEKAHHTETVDKVFDWISGMGDVLVEERIVPVKAMQEFHPLTVQSIRCATYLNDDGSTTIIGAFMRLGMGNHFVDSGLGGGMLAGIDME